MDTWYHGYSNRDGYKVLMLTIQANVSRFHLTEAHTAKTGANVGSHAGMSQILVVSNDEVGLAAMLSVLDHAGHQAQCASTFEDASRLLDQRSPDFVIADGRLGAYNGLHLIMRARAIHPETGAIVTTSTKDRGLEADARDLNVECMVKPENPVEWLEPISKWAAEHSRFQNS